MKTVVDYLQANKKYVHDCQDRYFELILEGSQILLNYDEGWAVIKTDLEGYEVENAIAEICDGNIEVSPFEKSCEFCEFKTLCMVEILQDKTRKKIYEKITSKTFEEVQNGEN
jgi:hypothetical protein